MKTVIKGLSKSFTFIELLIVIVILGISVGIGIPAFRKTFQSQQLNIFTHRLQGLIRYLHGRSVAEEKIIYLALDSQVKEYWIGAKGNPARLKTYRIPYDIKMSADKEEVLFYPDGSIDPVNITLSAPGEEKISLTTKGVFGGAKIFSQK